MQAFDEMTRWISPIGMSPRRVAKPWSIDGIDLDVDDRVFLMFGSANRDERHFVDGERFDIARNTSKAIVFGVGLQFPPALAVALLDGRLCRPAECVRPAARPSGSMARCTSVAGRSAACRRCWSWWEALADFP